MVRLVEFLGIGFSVRSAGGGATGGRFEIVRVLQSMGLKVCVTVRETVLPPRPWLMVKEFLGAGPMVGTGRGGAREGGSAGGVASGGSIGVVVGVGAGNGINEMEKLGRLGVIIGIGGMLIIGSVGWRG
jgi:hypothetical protein